MWKRATGSCYMLLSKQVVSQDGRSGKKKKKKLKWLCRTAI